MSRKLNQRLATIPAAAVVTSAWLKARGISSRLADYYCRSGWLHRVGDGAFTTRPGTPSWMGAVHGLQQRPSSVHPGGRTALEIFGHAHFIPVGSNYPIYLFGRTNDRLPSWFRGLPWFGRVQHVRTNFLPDGLGALRPQRRRASRDDVDGRARDPRVSSASAARRVILRARQLDLREPRRPSARIGPIASFRLHIDPRQTVVPASGGKAQPHVDEAHRPHPDFAGTRKSIARLRRSSRFEIPDHRPRKCRRHPDRFPLTSYRALAAAHRTALRGICLIRCHKN